MCQVGSPGDETKVDESRRSERSRRAILRAAIEIATENGYGKLSIEAIAARAGVGKQTIYRWWPSKGAVVMDAFIDHTAQALEWQPHDDIVEELVAQVRRVHGVLSNPRLAGHISGLVGEAQRDPEVADRFQRHVVAPYREVTIQGLERAQRRGDLSADADLALLADSLFAPLWFRLLLNAAPLAEFDPDTHVRQLLAGAGGS